jgi:hypothetical protein
MLATVTTRLAASDCFFEICVTARQLSIFNGLRPGYTQAGILRNLRHRPTAYRPPSTVSHSKPLYPDPAFCYTFDNAPRIIGGKAL